MKILPAKKPPGEMPVVELVLDGFIGRWFAGRGWAGTAIALPFVCLIFYYLDPRPLVRVHEHHHVAQAQTLGFLRWWLEYLGAVVKNYPFRGVLTGRVSVAAAMLADYRANPLEIEAYAVEDAARANGLPDWAQ